MAPENRRKEPKKAKKKEEKTKKTKEERKTMERKEKKARDEKKQHGKALADPKKKPKAAKGKGVPLSKQREDRPGNSMPMSNPLNEISVASATKGTPPAKSPNTKARTPTARTPTARSASRSPSRIPSREVTKVSVSTTKNGGLANGKTAAAAAKKKKPKPKTKQPKSHSSTETSTTGAIPIPGVKTKGRNDKGRGKDSQERTALVVGGIPGKGRKKGKNSLNSENRSSQSPNKKNSLESDNNVTCAVKTKTDVEHLSKRVNKMTADSRNESLPDSKRLNKTVREYKSKMKEVAKVSKEKAVEEEEEEEEEKWFREDGTPVWVIPEEKGAKAGKEEGKTNELHPMVLDAMNEDGLEFEENDWLAIGNDAVSGIIGAKDPLKEPGVRLNPYAPLGELRKLDKYFEPSAIFNNTAYSLGDMSRATIQRLEEQKKLGEDRKRPPKWEEMRTAVSSRIRFDLKNTVHVAYHPQNPIKSVRKMLEKQPETAREPETQREQQTQPM